MAAQAIRPTARMRAAKIPRRRQLGRLRRVTLRVGRLGLNPGEKRLQTSLYRDGRRHQAKEAGVSQDTKTISFKGFRSRGATSRFLSSSLASAAGSAWYPRAMTEPS